MCDPTGSKNIGRDGLYKSLALAALAQQGKGIDEKVLQHYGESGECHLVKLGDKPEEAYTTTLLLNLKPYVAMASVCISCASWPPQKGWVPAAIFVVIQICRLFPLTELPSPSLGPIAEMRDSCMKLFRATRPTELGYTYEELKSMDEILVTLIPEKKGVVFKHVEYLVESKVKRWQGR